MIGRERQEVKPLRSRVTACSLRLTASGGGGRSLPVRFPSVTDVKDADNARCGIVLVYHAVVTNPDSVDALRPDQFPASHRSRVVCQRSIAARMRGTCLRSIPRSSRSAERFHSTRQEATGLQPLPDRGMCTGGFVATLGYDREVVKVLEQLFVFVNG
jgi:hypothetical protein